MYLIQGNPHKTIGGFLGNLVLHKIIFKVLKEKDCQPRILYSAKQSFRNEGKIKISPDKQILRKFIIIRLALQEMLNEVLQAEMKTYLLVT